MERRTFLKTTAGIATAATIGAVSFSQTGAASDMQISTQPVELTNDDGEVREVSIDPQLHINWSDLDDAVGAVSIFIEARVNGDTSGPNDGFFPLHRSEPVVLPNSQSGLNMSAASTTGYFEMTSPISALGDNRTLNEDWASGTSDDGNLTVADAEDGEPDYSGASEGYLQGANVYGATIPSGQPLVNGEYGAASGTQVFEADTDGGSKTTTVEVRYTVQLLQMGLNHFAAITGTDPVAETDGTIGAIRQWLEDHYDQSAGEWDGSLNNTEHISDVMPEDITVIGVTDAGDYTTDSSEVISWETNQKLPVMTGPNEDYPSFDTVGDSGPTSRHAADAREYLNQNEGYPGVLTQTVSFDVTVNNEISSGSLGGNNNGSAK